MKPQTARLGWALCFFFACSFLVANYGAYKWHKEYATIASKIAELSLVTNVYWRSGTNVIFFKPFTNHKTIKP